MGEKNKFQPKREQRHNFRSEGGEGRRGHYSKKERRAAHELLKHGRFNDLSREERMLRKEF